ncbi:adenylate kinase-domain-containing protein [Mycena rebaudengoi]|nr:adenylate kinase-domain-containing protein [Mycena rebaudengoi]
MQALRSARPTPTTHPHRSIAHSAAARRALPFFLNTFRAAQVTERDPGKILRLVIFGKPGAGKGTLSARLVKKYDIVSLSTGDLLRQAHCGPIGLQAEEIVAQGNFLPDDVMLKIVTSKLDAIRNKHWILDGFPRTVGQGGLLDAHLKFVEFPDVARISDRWVHLPSGRVYNMSFNPPKVDGFDDETGEPLTKRPDDNPEIFARRLNQFYESTSPLIAYYSSSSKKPTPLPRISTGYQHPHQLSFPPAHTLLLKTLSGTTSDEIWPQARRTCALLFPRSQGEGPRLSTRAAAVASATPFWRTSLRRPVATHDPFGGSTP